MSRKKQKEQESIDGSPTTRVVGSGAAGERMEREVRCDIRSLRFPWRNATGHIAGAVASSKEWIVGMTVKAHCRGCRKFVEVLTYRFQGRQRLPVE